MTGLAFEAFIKRVFEATGLSSQSELAQALHINRSAITQARKKNTIPDKWLLQLFRSFGVNPEWLEKGVGPTYLNNSRQGDTNFIGIPKVTARLNAGGGSFEVDSDIDGYYSFRSDWLKKKGAPEKMVLMDIFGDSMEPELKDGDTVLIDQSQENIIAGAVYAVGVDDTILVKRVEKHPNKLVLLSTNRDYAPVYLQGDDIHTIRIIGKVIWICREFR